MKLLFLDISKDHVRLRGTNLRLPTGLVITAIISFFGPQSVAAEKSVCTMPKGDFTDSCTGVAITPYTSIDPNVPQTCVLTAECPTMFSGLPPVHNNIFIPAHMMLDDVRNQNGTLTHGGKSLRKESLTSDSSSSPLSSDDCLPPNGSYSLTCKTTRKPYISKDPNLQNTDLCEAESKCETLGGKRSTSMVYYNIRGKNSPLSATVLENCDGALIAGSNDRRCQIGDVDRIKEIANDSGRKPTLTL